MKKLTIKGHERTNPRSERLVTSPIPKKYRSRLGRCFHPRLGASTGKSTESSAGGSSPIPDLTPQWKKLDLAEILSRPAAFVSISQNKSLYETSGAQGAEKHRERTSLPATVKVVEAARAANNFRSFSWIGYEVFREKYPQSTFDKVQYETWVEGLNFSPEQKIQSRPCFHGTPFEC